MFMLETLYRAVVLHRLPEDFHGSDGRLLLL